MSAPAMFVATLAALLAVGVAARARFAIAEVEQQLRSFSGFHGMHFDIDPEDTKSAEGAT